MKLLAPKSRSRSKAVVPTDEVLPAGVELGRRVQVGPYDIQPARGVGPHALEGLNTWLQDHGFPTEDPGHMAYFVEKNFTFLCVRIIPPGQEKAVAASGVLPPLQLSFRSAAPYYPLRFSSRQGVFDVNLHVLTRDKFDFDANAATLAKINWASQDYSRNAKLSEREMPDTLKAVFTRSVWKGDIGRWRYNNLRCFQVNRDGAIARWTEDIFFVSDK